MQIPRVSVSKTGRMLLVASAIMLMLATLVWAFQPLTSPSSAHVNGPISGTLNSVNLVMFNTTSIPCTVSGNTASCPQVQLTQGGSVNESGNYTVVTAFTATAGAHINISCPTSGVLGCSLSSTALIATGTSQTVTATVLPTGSGNGTVTVTIAG